MRLLSSAWRTDASAATSRPCCSTVPPGLKYPLPPVHRVLDRLKPIDFAAL